RRDLRLSVVLAGDAVDRHEVADLKLRGESVQVDENAIGCSWRRVFVSSAACGLDRDALVATGAVIAGDDALYGDGLPSQGRRIASALYVGDRYSRRVRGLFGVGGFLWVGRLFGSAPLRRDGRRQ